VSIQSQPDRDTSRLEIRLFGTVEVRLPDHSLLVFRSRKEMWLLALLVLRQDRETSREWLAALLWPDAEESQALYNLRRSLSHLRTALGDERDRLLSPTSRTLRFDMIETFADVLAFDKTVASLRRDSTVAQEAIALYRGPLLADCPDEWATAERETRALSYLKCLEILGQQAIAHGEPVAAVGYLRQAISADPYAEHLHRALMNALAASGDRAALTQVYRELRLRLHNELNTEPGPETQNLYQSLMCAEALPTPATPTPAKPSVASPSTVATPALRRHLPVPLSSLVGRGRECDEVIGWMSRRRLTTLVGAGGVGKTRLAIAAAERMTERFPDGVWFVDLARLTDPALIPQTIARTLRVSLEDNLRPPVEELAEVLAARSLLLVLDNCEHLVNDCAALTHQLLAACPDLRVLATSRQLLGIPGEQVYRVPSLTLPPDETDPVRDQNKDLSALLDSEAMRLFVERATQANSDFRLNRRNATAVAALCRELDGIPLAIEMAAARMRSLSPQEVHLRLKDRFRLLTTGDRTVLPRQQTLRAAVDWSYSLLSAQEKLALQRLAVFTGGWNLEAAEVICADAPESSASVMPDGPVELRKEDILDCLTSLTDKSLILYKDDGSQPRYGMLETVRQYGLEKLEESGEVTRLRRRHRFYFWQFAAQMQFYGRTNERDWQNQLEREHPNIRAAMDFCESDTENVESGELGMRFISALLDFWVARGYISEGMKRCETLLAHPAAQAPTALRGYALTNFAGMAFYHSDFQRERVLAEEALAIQRKVGAPAELARALNVYGNALVELGEYALAQTMREECLAIWREQGEQNEIALILMDLGVVAHAQHNDVWARQLQEESLAIRRTIGDEQGIAGTLHALSTVDYSEGNYAAARASLEEALAINRKLGNRTWAGFNLRMLGWTHLAEGNDVEAYAACYACLELQKEFRNKRELASIFECLAELADRQERWQDAARLWGCAATFRESIGRSDATSDHQRRRKESATRESAGETLFVAAWDEGKQMTTEQAISYALGMGGYT
jgi:predicted ATPase/DNA-binding SARP family transcriptional activator